MKNIMVQNVYQPNVIDESTIEIVNKTGLFQMSCNVQLMYQLKVLVIYTLEI